MTGRRINYIIIILIIILLGLGSRKVEAVPLFVGDCLWAAMIFFMVGCVMINSNAGKCASVSLLICYGVEVSQLYQAQWINSLRQTLPGRLILGQGFLWTDLIAYAAGIAIAVFAELVISRGLLER